MGKPNDWPKTVRFVAGLAAVVTLIYFCREVAWILAMIAGIILLDVL